MKISLHPDGNFIPSRWKFCSVLMEFFFDNNEAYFHKESINDNQIKKSRQVHYTLHIKTNHSKNLTFAQNLFMKHIFGILLLIFTLFSCARLGAPVGGDQDTIAPRPLAVNIDSPFTQVPKDFRTLRIKFDEYITLKDIQKNLIISPPIKHITKILPSNLPTKELVIEWKDTLQANTTYSFNFGNAIRDNNEGNVLPYYNFAFSTGEKIADLYLSGYLKEGYHTEGGAKKSGTENASVKVVGLYPYKDTIDYNKKPIYITKVDEDGYFELNYLSKGTYKIIGFEDKNENAIFDSGTEYIAFLRDTLHINESHSKVQLSLFPSKKAVKYVEAKEIPGGALFLFEGNTSEVNLQPENKDLVYKVHQKPHSDSVQVFVDTTQEIFKKNTPQNLTFEYTAGEKKGKASLFFRNTQPPTLSLSGEAILPPKSDFIIKSNLPLEKLDTSGWKLMQDSLTTIPFKAEIMPKDATKITISAEFLEDKKYTLTVPKASIISFFTSNEKTHQWDFTLDKISNYGSLELRLKNTEQTPQFRWIQLINTEGKIIAERYTSDKNIKFSILKPGEYHARILVDENHDEFWSPADLQNQQYAEPVFIFPKKITIRPLWELIEDWNLENTTTPLDASSIIENKDEKTD